MGKVNYNKVHLFILKVLGIETAAEKKEYEEEINGQEKYRKLGDSISDPRAYRLRQELLGGIDTEKELEQFLRTHSRRRRSLGRVYGRVAATIALLIGIGGAWYMLQSPSAEKDIIRQAGHVHPGIQGAVLVLSDGTQQNLESRGTHIMESDGSRILNDSSQLNYTQVTTDQDKDPIYNHLIVGRGFEYMLVLQDGTKVWMNSESRLDYPIQFSSTTRTVKLSGEAYFEVTPDAKRPFIVAVNEQFHVKVLGTHFNIKAYPGDDRAETTLVEGKVAVDNIILRPSEQAVIYKGQAPEIRKVNVDYYTAWHEGWFYFNNERLERALEQIGRWYDVTFVFSEDDVRQLMVTGKLKRFENLSVILDMLTTTTQCQFEIKGNKVYVTKRK